MNELTLTTPFPPSVNTYWRRCKGRAGMFISERGQRFADAVIYEHYSPRVIFSEDKRLAVTVKLFPPDRRKRDLDNFNKGLLDALTKARIYADDSQIDELRIIRCEKTKGGKAEVEIKVIK